MGQLGIFAHLARLQAQLRPPPAVALPENIDGLFEMPSGDTVQFGEQIAGWQFMKPFGYVS